MQKLTPISDQEEWRDVAGFVGLYRVSNFGRVLSMRRYNTPGGLLRLRLIKGYPYVSLSRPGLKKGKLLSVHSLVAEAFLGPPPPGMEVGHRNGDRSNPRLDNLRYVTRKQNQADRYDHGTMIHGDEHPWSKLTAAKVVEMRRERRAGASYDELAEAYGVKFGAAYAACTGRTWKTLPNPTPR